jgi:hypothetical protein
VVSSKGQASQVFGVSVYKKFDIICVIHSIAGFFNFVNHLVFKRIQPSGNWICFHLQMKGWKAPTLLGVLERANPNSRTIYVNIYIYIYKFT